MTIVDRLYKEFSEMMAFFDAAGEISFRSNFDEYFRKHILLCASSYFEYRITHDVHQFSLEIAGNNTLIPELIKNKVINRQYHTWFDWTSSNANTFFSLFGKDFRKFMTEKLSSDIELLESIKAFIEIGNQRNRLVHQDFGSFSLEKTGEEIYGLYRTSLRFVDAIPFLFRECSCSRAE